MTERKGHALSVMKECKLDEYDGLVISYLSLFCHFKLITCLFLFFVYLMHSIHNNKRCYFNSIAACQGCHLAIYLQEHGNVNEIWRRYFPQERGQFWAKIVPLTVHEAPLLLTGAVLVKLCVLAQHNEIFINFLSNASLISEVHQSRF